MKKVLLITALVLFSANVFSQVKFGVRAGINQAKLTNTKEYKTDFYAGAMLNIHLSDLYELQPEVTYSRQGGSYEQYYSAYDSSTGNYINGTATRDVDLNYISIGVTNKFFVMKDEKFHLLAGPSIDFIFENNFVNLINEDNEIEFTPIDFSFYAGVGYQFDFGLSVEARYKQGVLDVNFDDEIYNNETGRYEDKTQLNSVIQLGVSYKFDFSKKED